MTDQRAARPSQVPIAAEWIEGRLLITGLAGAAAGQVKAGLAGHPADLNARVNQDASGCDQNEFDLSSSPTNPST